MAEAEEKPKSGIARQASEGLRHRQDHIEFLEEYISEITAKIDELTDGRNLEKMIDRLEYRIEILSQADTRFSGRINELKTELKALKAEYNKVRPIIEELEAERTFYRDVQSEL